MRARTRSTLAPAPRHPLRPRSQLVYSWNEELPTHIHEPDSPLFPLVALAKAEADGAGESTSIAEYADAARSLLKEHLTSHGAVLLRGLPLADSADYSTFVTALGWDAVKLAGGGTQRSDIQSNVRSASDEPPEQTPALALAAPPREHRNFGPC